MSLLQTSRLEDAFDKLNQSIQGDCPHPGESILETVKGLICKECHKRFQA